MGSAAANYISYTGIISLPGTDTGHTSRRRIIFYSGLSNKEAHGRTHNEIYTYFLPRCFFLSEREMRPREKRPPKSYELATKSERSVHDGYVRGRMCRGVVKERGSERARERDRSFQFVSSVTTE